MGFFLRKLRVKIHPDDIDTLASKESLLNPQSPASLPPFSPLGSPSPCPSPGFPSPGPNQHFDAQSQPYQPLYQSSSQSPSLLDEECAELAQLAASTMEPQFLGFNSATLPLALSRVTKLYADNKDDCPTFDFRTLDLPYAEIRAFRYVQRLADATPSVPRDQDFDTRIRDHFPAGEREFRDVAVRHFIHRVGTWHHLEASQRRQNPAGLRQSLKRRSWIFRDEQAWQERRRSGSVRSELGRLLKEEKKGKRDSGISIGPRSSSELGQMLNGEKAVFGANIPEDLMRTTTLEGLAQLLLEVKRLDAGLARLPNDIALLRRKSNKSTSWD